MNTTTRLVGLALVAAALLAAGPAFAHPLAPSLLQLRNTEGSRFTVVWKTPLRRPVGMELEPVLPERCRAISPPESRREQSAAVTSWSVDCGGGLAAARVGVSGMAPRGPGAVVLVELASGARVQGVVTAGRPFLSIPEAPSAAAVVRSYLQMGAEHLWFGLDHVLFVLGLLLLVRGPRALLLTVLGFTLGHSVTLSLVALGWIHVPSRLVEVAIAGTLVLLALDLVRSGPGPGSGSGSLFGERPWRMATAFGLLHGLGFAGALAEVGLPPSEIPLALLCFNVGIEIGQLTLIALAIAVSRGARPFLSPLPPRLPRLAAAYGIGSLAAYWMLERAVAAWSAG